MFILFLLPARFIPALEYFPFTDSSQAGAAILDGKEMCELVERTSLESFPVLGESAEFIAIT
jgi:hypothetical protein